MEIKYADKELSGYKHSAGERRAARETNARALAHAQRPRQPNARNRPVLDFFVGSLAIGRAVKTRHIVPVSMAGAPSKRWLSRGVFRSKLKRSPPPAPPPSPLAAKALNMSMFAYNTWVRTLGAPRAPH